MEKITKDVLYKAESDLQAYKQGKMNLESRIVENEEWWKLRHTEKLRREANMPEPASAFLFNSLLNKHADAMDNYPEPGVLPREASDTKAAATLSQVLPVILEHNEFEQAYSDAWWYKLKAGTAVYGVFWNRCKGNGLGDIEIRRVDLLNLFWEPGVNDIEKSRQLFHVELQGNEGLEKRYPQLSGKLGGESGQVAAYDTPDLTDNSQKTAVVDWYFKVEENGVTRLHYVKFCAGEVLYNSLEDLDCREDGFYRHGQFPFVFDVLFPQEGSPAGFGYIDIMKSPQTAIDQLGAVMLQNALLAGKKRFFIRQDGSVNEEEFANWQRDFVHVSGNLGEDSIREIRVDPLNSSVVAMYQAKIEELKETSGNRDFNQGSTRSGVTAASAIAALQEAGSKLSRDMIKSSYRAFAKVCGLTIELIRQFYDMPRFLRIVGDGGREEFIQFDNAMLLPDDQGGDFGLDLGSRLPVFDVVVKPQKSNPYNKMAQNELAKEFYRLGFFNPAMADQALACMDMMDFDGRETVRQGIAKNAALQMQVQQLQEQMMKMAAIIDAQNGSGIAGSMGAEFQGKAPAGGGAPGAGAEEAGGSVMGGMEGMGALGGLGAMGAMGTGGAMDGSGGTGAMGAAPAGIAPGAMAESGMTGGGLLKIQPAQEIMHRIRKHVAQRGDAGV